MSYICLLKCFCNGLNTYFSYDINRSFRINVSFVNILQKKASYSDAITTIYLPLVFFCLYSVRATCC